MSKRINIVLPEATVQAIDRRFVKRLGAVDEQTLERIDEAIKISLGLICL